MNPASPAAEPFWIVCQLGAREHYAAPAALHQAGQLRLLATDFWQPPGRGGVLTRWLPRAATRFEPALAGAPVVAFSASFAVLALLKRMSRRWPSVGDLLTRTGDWLFQRRAAAVLNRVPAPTEEEGPTAPVVFAYSYSAGRIFRAAKRRGWTTVLGQINPGPHEEEIVAEVFRQEFGDGVVPPKAPPAYWARWREECALSDAIVVNSEWSFSLLAEAGIPAEKIHVIPLAYRPPAEATGFRREYPAEFTRARPLRVLYLGAVHPRKGPHVLLRAARALAEEGASVEVLLVGRDEMPGGLAGRLPGNARHEGEVERRTTGTFFRQADVFILPTFSDGFALTLLEAQAWRLPVIASRHCGKVVEDGVNGLELAEVTEGSIADALRVCAAAPDRLRGFADRRVDLAEFSLEAFGRRLRGVLADAHGGPRETADV